MKKLENDYMKAIIRKKGAELVSLRGLSDGCEYIWYGDKPYWDGHSPHLFPIICATNNNVIRIKGEKYPIDNHGFAKDSMFDVVSENTTQIVYQLCYNNYTMKRYPYKFKLIIKYTLKKNILEIGYKVINCDNKMMFFQLGTHAGFNCPLDPNDRFENYYLQFAQKETFERYFINEKNLLIAGKSVREVNDGRVINLTHSMFNEGALIFRELKSREISLRSTQSRRCVTLRYSDMPCLGLWQPQGAPFICIEPWQGIAETDGLIEEFEEKEYGISLGVNEEYNCSYAIEVI